MGRWGTVLPIHQENGGHRVILNLTMGWDHDEQPDCNLHLTEYTEPVNYELTGKNQDLELDWILTPVTLDELRSLRRHVDEAIAHMEPSTTCRPIEHVVSDADLRRLLALSGDAYTLGWEDGDADLRKRIEVMING